MLSVDIVGLMGGGDSKTSSRFTASKAQAAAWEKLSPDARQMLDKEHDAIVAEVRLRLEQEHLLFALKFGLVGAILWAFLQTAFGSAAARFDRTPFAALAAWAAVVASSIVDLRVVANQAFLVALGGWTRQYEQMTLGANGVSFGWEAYLADNLLSGSHYPALRVSSQILTALLFCVTSLLFLVRPEGDNEPNTARISSAGSVLTIVILTMAAVSIRRDKLAIAIYLTTGVLAILVSSILVRASHRSEQLSVPTLTPAA